MRGVLALDSLSVRVGYKLPAATELLLPGPADTNFFETTNWFSCLEREGFAESPALRVYSVARGNGAESPCYLFLREESAGRRLLSLTNPYSVRFPGIVPGQVADRVTLDHIVGTIAEERPRWTELELRFLPGWDRQTHVLAEVLRGRGYRVGLEHHYWNWFANVEGKGFQEYLAGRSGRVRSTLDRRQRRAAAKHEMRFELVSDARNLEPAIAHYQQVYARSWKPEENRPQFMLKLIRECASLGVLRLGVLYLDEVPAAVQFWIVSAGQACIYKLAHDPQFDDLSVGTLLNGYMFEQVLERDHVREIDFGVGDEPYKRDWMDRRRQLLTLRAMNPRTFRGALLSGRLAIRSVLQKVGLRDHVPLQRAPDD